MSQDPDYKGPIFRVTMRTVPGGHREAAGPVLWTRDMTESEYWRFLRDQAETSLKLWQDANNELARAVLFEARRVDRKKADDQV